MTRLSNAVMLEATRLTREGRLHEATAVLREMLANTEGSASAGKDVSAPKPEGSTKPALDMMPPLSVGGVWTLPKGGDISGIAGLRSTRRAPPLARGARFEECAYTSEAGRCAYKLYIPSGYDGSALPLVVMLHGCTQSPDDFAAGTQMNRLAEEGKFMVAYPAQTQSANAAKCWNWFNPVDQQRDRGEPALIAGVTRQVIRDLAVDRARVYVAGLSAGGAAAAVMSANYPDIYAALGVHSGLPCGAATDLASAFVAMRNGPSQSLDSGVQNASRRFVPTIVFHGDLDGTVSPVNGHLLVEQARAQTKKLTVAASEGVAPGGIRYTRTVHADASGKSRLEHWLLHQAGHAWSGGSPAGSFTDSRGPDASREIIRFFNQHRNDCSKLAEGKVG